ncbi:MAG: cytidylate kinase family protein [Spirochaetales bacterium]|uniref:(d)CMP kinase n=1 Tax=Candidatus Thalassospirochaeta sargassi TaxID=3119039 RepID=A0AAJ1MN69_9SPIO|nr:cytidylate kinase family protein [Spirochaetales bacterium]
MKEGMKIAISGKSGCGNSTVSRLVAEKLGFEMINFTFRQLAEEKGLEFRELCEASMTDFSYDRELDSRQVEMASGGNCVLGSRLAVWMLKDADLKVFLNASAEVRSGRIQQREGGSLNDVLAVTEKRDKNDSSRYREIYEIDNNEFGFVDLVVRADRLDQYQIADIIVAAAKSIE